MELSDVPIHPSAERLGLDIDQYETVLLFKCCATEFGNGLIEDQNGYEGGHCPKCGTDDPAIVRRVV